MSEVLARPGPEAPPRADRAELFAFVTDADSIATLRAGLDECGPRDFEIRRAGIGEATAMLKKMPTPRTMIVDISGEEQPLSALDRLSEVVEPDVRVLLLGDRGDANFYRQVTRGLGVLEYLHKPLQRDMVARYFSPLVSRQATLPLPVHGGRVVSVTGVRGGVGASTLATNLAWHFGVEAARHTILADADLQRGTCAMLLGAATGSGLRTALEKPERVDRLFVERTAQAVRDRLHILAAEEKLLEQPGYAEGAAHRVLLELRNRYNFVIVDLPFTTAAMHRDMMMLAHHRALVMEPTLACVRDMLRLLALPNGPMQPGRPLIVLNRCDRRGLLTRRQVEDALALKIDIAVPDMTKLVGNAATLGEAAIRAGGPFRRAVLELAQEIALLRTAPSAAVDPVMGKRRFWSRAMAPARVR